jgi:LysR family transcriptional activator of nhaA
MDLNYNHLRYFWAVARDGSIAAASERLHMAMPTISGQIKKLEQTLGGPLLTRCGRGLELTDLGRHVYGYAEEIFELGDELVHTIGDADGVRPRSFKVGVANVVPKLVAYSLLEPALQLEPAVEMVVHEDEPERLLADLAIQKLDLVITDAPIPPHINVRAYNHELGSSGVGMFAAPELADSLRPGFPQSLDGAALLLPTEQSVLAGAIARWCRQLGITPRVIGRFENSSLLKVFAGRGHGCFAAPLATAQHLQDQHGATLIGTIDDLTDRYYAISVERRIRHPAVAAILDAARQVLG